MRMGMTTMAMNSGFGVAGWTPNDMVMEFVIPAEGGTVTLPIVANATYFPAGYTDGITINWGDGTITTMTNGTAGTPNSHIYTVGTYIVVIRGRLKKFGTAATWVGKDLIKNLLSWGTLGTIDCSFAFYISKSLQGVATNFPTGVTLLNSTFTGCSNAAFNPDVSSWDVGNVTNMYGLFDYCNGSAFNPDVSSWDVRKVTTFYNFFRAVTGSFTGGKGVSGTGLKNWKIAAAAANAGYGFAGAAKSFGTSWLDEILIAWAARIGANPDPLSTNVTWHFQGTQKYSAAAAAAYTALTTPVENGGAGWTIICGGQA